MKRSTSGGTGLCTTVVVGFVLVAALAARAYAHDIAPPPVGPIVPPNDGALHGAAFAAAKAGKWETAFSLAAKGGEPLAAKVIAWLSFTRAQPVPSFAAIADFIGSNPEWPRPRVLRRRAEAAMSAHVEDARVLSWFEAYPPLSGLGRVRLAEAYLRAGDVDKATTLMRDAWIGGNFNAGEQKTVLARHRKLLRPEDHIARLDRLLWDGRRSQARRMLRRVDAGHRALGLARLKLMARAGGVDAAIARVPESLRDDPGLWFERLRWRRRKGFDDRAREVLEALPDDLMRPKAWGREAFIQSRRAVTDGFISEAYRFASRHRQSDGLFRAEAEWLAGWIALRFLVDPDLGYRHFVDMHSGVSSPISIARAAYWAGRAAAAADNSELAQSWYELAGRHPTTFYGQLALAALGTRGPLPLPPEPEVSADDVAFVDSHELTRVVRMFAEAGESEMMRVFILRLTDLADTPGRRGLVAAVAVAWGRRDLAVAAARRSARKGSVIVEHGYPEIPLPPSPDGSVAVEAALVLAMVRQESGFEAAAVSRARARGLMQLLPRTARDVARRIKVPFSKERLTGDEDYNLTLGRAYMAELLGTYDGSYVLALAAYNAGIRRVRLWINEYGDPRAGDVDVIDWIELVPFSETRNYLQRVLEAVPVYRRVLGQPTPAGALAVDLARGATLK